MKNTFSFLCDSKGNDRAYIQGLVGGIFLARFIHYCLQEYNCVIYPGDILPNKVSKQDIFDFLSINFSADRKSDYDLDAFESYTKVKFQNEYQLSLSSDKMQSNHRIRVPHSWE